MAAASQYFLKRIESERRISLPLCFFNNESLNRLDRLLETKNPSAIANFFKNFGSSINLEPAAFLSNKLKEPRDVSETDLYIIKELMKVKKQDPELFFDFAGSLYYITSLVDDMQSQKASLTQTITISLQLWLYLYMVELTMHFVSKLLRDYIKDSPVLYSNKIDDFNKSFKNGEHPTIGQIRDLLEKLHLLDHQKESIFNGKFIRNKIAHSNLFYDKDRDAIYLSNGRVYPAAAFKSDFKRLYDFLGGLLYQYNAENNDLKKSIKIQLNQIAQLFRKIARSGDLTRAFHSVIFEWEK